MTLSVLGAVQVNSRRADPQETMAHNCIQVLHTGGMRRDEVGLRAVRPGSTGTAPAEGRLRPQERRQGLRGRADERGGRSGKPAGADLPRCPRCPRQKSPLPTQKHAFPRGQSCPAPGRTGRRGSFSDPGVSAHTPHAEGPGVGAAQATSLSIQTTLPRG